VGSADRRLRALRCSEGIGPDYAERATQGLMACLDHEGNAGEALRYAARLLRENPSRQPALYGLVARTTEQAGAPSLAAAQELQVQLRGLFQAPADPALLWHFEADTFLHTPVIANGMAYAGSPVQLWAFDAHSGEHVWNVAEGEDTPVIADGVAYAGSRDHGLQAYDTHNGNKLWGFPAPDQVRVVTIADGVIYAGSRDDHLRTFDAKTGNLLHDFQQGDAADAWMITEGVVCTWSRDQHLLAYDPQSGERLWDAAMEDGAYDGDNAKSVRPHLRSVEGKTGKLKWSHDGLGCQAPVIAAGAVYAAAPDELLAFDAQSGEPKGSASGWDFHAPAIAEGGVYAMCSDRLLAFDAQTLKPRWDREAEGAEAVVLADGVAYAWAPADQHLWAFEAKDGTPLWKYEASSFLNAPVIEDGVAYLMSWDGHLHAFVAKTGQALWGCDSPGAYAAVLGEGLICVGSDDNHLRVFEAKSGKLLWDYPAGSFISRPVIAEGAVYAVPQGAPSGYLRAFDLQKIKAGVEPPCAWVSVPQFWSWIIWGKGGLALSKMADRIPLNQILKYDHWDSAEALAAKIDGLAGLGDWNDEGALAQDPASLSPPELVFDANRKDANGQTVRAAAQMYLRAAKALGGADGLEYAREAARLAPTWAKAQETVTRLEAQANAPAQPD
jgi:eukaryotic-like serine/threonine-protein kinase